MLSLTSFGLAISLFLCPLLILSCLFFVWRGRGDNVINSVILLFGCAFAVIGLFFSDPNASKLSLSPQAVTYEKRGPSAEITASNTVILQPFIEKTNQAIDDVNKALQAQDKRINDLIASANSTKPGSNISSIETKPVQRIQANTAVQPGKTVLVFYKTNSTLASDITSILTKNGYKSTALESSLDEVKSWVKSSSPNSITIAANGNQQQFAETLKDLLLKSSPSDFEKTTITADSDWQFKASDAQIYIF